MISFRIKSTGLDQLIKNIENVNIKRLFVDAANRSIVEVQKRAIVEVPVRTSLLQKSHILTPATMNTLRAEVYTDKEYAVPVHEGHRIVAWGHDTGRRKAPNPWMERAVNSTEPTVDKIFDIAADRVAQEITK